MTFPISTPTKPVTALKSSPSTSTMIVFILTEKNPRWFDGFFSKIFFFLPCSGGLSTFSAHCFPNKGCPSPNSHSWPLLFPSKSTAPPYLLLCWTAQKSEQLYSFSYFNVHEAAVSFSFMLLCKLKVISYKLAAEDC